MGMRYFVILLIVLSIAGCKRQTAVFENSLEIVERNFNAVEKAKDDIGKIQEAREQRIANMREFITNDANSVNDDGGDVRDGVGSESHTNDDDVIIPETFDLPIKFSPQAPFAVWDDLHQEACEEAAMIMAVKYLKAEDLDKQIMENEIQAMVKWEGENGY